MSDENKEIKDDIKEEVVEKEVEEKDTTNPNDELNKLKDAFTRLQADFTNYKRRVEKEKTEIYKYASEGLILKLLNVTDNFDRALAGVEKEDSFVKGIKMIRKEFGDILIQEGLEEIESDNAKFDANLHHAVFSEEKKELEPETVMETFQKGYKLKDKVIRPAMVKVSK